MSQQFTPHHYADEETTAEPEKLLTIWEVARALRVNYYTVKRWIKSGSLEAVTLPHRGKRQTHRIKQSVLDVLKTPTLQRR